MNKADYPGIVAGKYKPIQIKFCVPFFILLLNPYFRRLVFRVKILIIGCRNLDHKVICILYPVLTAKNKIKAINN